MNVRVHKSSLALLMDAAGWDVAAKPQDLFRFSEEEWASAFSADLAAQRPSKIVAVGHRGAKYHAPENTILAHERAYKMGARAIEFDVRCTKDGEFVIIHDKKVNRTTNGKGKIKDLTLAEVKALTVGSSETLPSTGTKIPTLREALRNVRGRFAVDIDFKSGPKNSADILENILREEGFDDDEAPLVTIFARRHHFDILKPLANHFQLRPHFFSHDQISDLKANYPVKTMGLRRLSFCPSHAAAIRHAGFHLFSNVMGPYDNRLGFTDAVRAGSRFIQTDYLNLLVPFLAERNLLETRVLGRDYEPLKSSVTRESISYPETAVA